MAEPTIAVIGRGLMGSAAARHLAAAGVSTILIGPDEPAGDWTAHDGVFASHYDEGRITRRLAHNLLWSRLSTAAIARYAEIEAAADLAFFSDVGAVMTGPAGGAFMSDVAAVTEAEAIDAERLSGPALSERLPVFRFPDGAEAFYEPTGCGHVSPRRLVAAQARAAERAGARILRDRVVAVRETPGCVEIRAAGGETLRADRALVATGGFTIDPALSTGPLDLTVYARTAVFFAIDADEAARLARMPSTIQKSGGSDWYLLPPIRYPDGRTYLKIGGDPDDRRLESPAELRDWFRSGGAEKVGPYLEDQLRAVMPDLRAERAHIVPCVTTWTAHGRPYIGAADGAERIAVLTGGNGAGAKCSDELGRLGARFVRGMDLAPDRYPEGFEPVFRAQAAAPASAMEA